MIYDPKQHSLQVTARVVKRSDYGWGPIWEIVKQEQRSGAVLYTLTNGNLTLHSFLFLSEWNVYSLVTVRIEPQCECGAAAIGVKPNEIGHASYCPARKS